MRGRFDDASGLINRPDDARLDDFKAQLRRCGFDGEGGLSSTPLLLNLMISEYIARETDRHALEQHHCALGASAIQFDGRIVPGQSEYVASFPGVEKKAWDSVTQVLQHRSVACVWLPDDSELNGKHYADPDDREGRCFCQTFLYHDLPDNVRAKDPFKMIMHPSDVHTRETMPAVGKKVEVAFHQTALKNGEFAPY